MGSAATPVDLGDVLALVVGARESYRTLRAEVRNWHHHARGREAHARRMDRGRSRSSRMVMWAVDVDSQGESREPDPVESEDGLRLWMRRPDRLREERWSTRRGRRVGEVLVQVGETWWSYDPDSGARTNAAARTEQQRTVRHGSQLEPIMLDPALLLAACTFEVVGPAVHAGRPAIRVAAQPAVRDVVIHDFPSLFGDWPRVILVDAERGVLLRSVSLLDGEPFAITEFVSIAFDEDLADERFVFVPPPGEALVDIDEELARHRHGLSLDEAAAGTSFALFVPSVVPDGWRMRVNAIAEGSRRNARASVNIHYSDEMARLNVNINEHAAGVGGLPQRSPDGGTWRVEQTVVGEVRLWEPAEAEHGMPRIAICEIAGTRIQISTGDLKLDAIRDLAASLVAAPEQPPALV